MRNTRQKRRTSLQHLSCHQKGSVKSKFVRKKGCGSSTKNVKVFRSNANDFSDTDYNTGCLTSDGNVAKEIKNIRLPKQTKSGESISTV
jgi:hypothetical protein